MYHISRKSQISTFTIIAIAILFLLGTMIIAVRYFKDIGGEKDKSQTLETISDPVQKYVTECLKLTSYDAIIQMGEHGGYTDLERNGISYDAANPTESDAVVLSLGGANPSGDLYAVPYYWYMSSSSGCQSNCEFKIQFPELYKDSGVASIEEELEYYIEENFARCISSFRDFKAQGYNITVKGEPSVVASINEETISFTLSYPLKIDQKDSSHTLEKYYATQNIEMMPIITLAMEITAKEARYRFLENQMINLIATYGGVGSILPPIAETGFEFGSPGQVWTKSNVKQEVQNIMSKYVHAIRAQGTNNYVLIGNSDPISSKMLDTYMTVPLSETYDLDAYFNYMPIWPIYFDLNCDGEICKSESYSNTFLLMIGTQKYRFFYSMSYPVIVRLHDSKALDGRGFNYYFFLEANFKNNEMIYPGEATTTFSLGGSSLMCNSNQRNSGNYTFNITNGLTHEPVDGVGIFYSCGTESCTMELANGSFSGALPICLGGTLSLRKENYMPYSKFLRTRVGDGEDLGEITLEPLRKRNITINKIKFVKQATDDSSLPWIRSGEGSLTANQEGIIILEKISEAWGEDSFVQIANINGSKATDEVSLVPGEYKVQVILTDKSSIIIPEEEREVNIIGSLVTTEYTMPEVRFNESAPWNLGGAEINATLSRSLVDSGRTISINAIAFEMGDVLEANRKIEDLQILSELANYSRDYSSQLGFR